MVKYIISRKILLGILCLTIGLLTLATTCRQYSNCPDYSHTTINIYNKSSKSVNYRHFQNDSVYHINGSQPADDLIISPNSSDTYGTLSCWESDYSNGYSNYFLIFDNDTVQAVGWQSINGTNRGLLKRIKVDLSYLQQNNFTITYP